MLELLTCKEESSIIVTNKGLHFILHPPHWHRYDTEIHDRFIAEKAFGTKFIHSIDCTLQTYLCRLDRITEEEPPIMEGSPTFLHDHAVDLISKLKSDSSITVSLPVTFLPRKP